MWHSAKDELRTRATNGSSKKPEETEGLAVTDGYCEPNEDTTNCPTDCKTSTCRDHVCEPTANVQIVTHLRTAYRRLGAFVANVAAEVCFAKVAGPSCTDCSQETPRSLVS
jgi:hypothetical protein